MQKNFKNHKDSFVDDQNVSALTLLPTHQIDLLKESIHPRIKKKLLLEC
jgi:hypothetical protein